MAHQLVIQFNGADFDGLIAIEEALIEGLGTSANVDGHDIGSGQSNIFIITTEPMGTFQRARDIISNAGLLPATFKAASRPLGSDVYVALWPPGLANFSIA